MIMMKKDHPAKATSNSLNKTIITLHLKIYLNTSFVEDIHFENGERHRKIKVELQLGVEESPLDPILIPIPLICVKLP